jgi:hypothetical protein
MSSFPGTYIPTGVSSTPAFNVLVDTLLTPRLMAFRQIHIHDEQADLSPDRLTWQQTFGGWLTAAPLIVRKNGVVLMPAQVTTIDYVHGTFRADPVDLGADQKPRDVVETTYQFDYFPTAIQEGLLTAAVSIVNMTAVGPPTYYTIDTMPSNWYGVVTDLAFAMCMEKLLLDYDLWRYRLLFAIGPGELETGGGDIASQLTTLKQNSEERANTAMQNPKFKTGNYLAPPTLYYYQAIRGLGGAISGPHGVPFLGGKLQGWKPTKIL